MNQMDKISRASSHHHPFTPDFSVETTPANRLPFFPSQNAGGPDFFRARGKSSCDFYRGRLLPGAVFQ